MTRAIAILTTLLLCACGTPQVETLLRCPDPPGELAAPATTLSGVAQPSSNDGSELIRVLSETVTVMTGAYETEANKRARLYTWGVDHCGWKR